MSYKAIGGGRGGRGSRRVDGHQEAITRAAPDGLADILEGETPILYADRTGATSGSSALN